jgi:hypothetical protein
MSFSNRNENAQVRPASKTMKKRETLVAELKFNPDSVMDDCVIADFGIPDFVIDQAKA